MFYKHALSSISTLLNANFDFDVSIAKDVAIDVANYKYALPGKVMQGSPCPEVHTLTNENGLNKMKLNDIGITLSV